LIMDDEPRRTIVFVRVMSKEALLLRGSDRPIVGSRLAHRPLPEWTLRAESLVRKAM